MDVDTYADKLRKSVPFTRGVVEAAINRIGLTLGSSGLDAGCGIDCFTEMLAEKIGCEGSVVGIDSSADFVKMAEASCGTGIAGRVTYQLAEFSAMPFPDHAFDWIFCKDSLWPGTGEDGCIADIASCLDEFRRVLKPDGKVALLYWSGQMLLPGYPDLEARCCAEFAENAPYLRDIDGDRHFLRASKWLGDAGFCDVSAEVVSDSVCGALSPEMRKSIAGFIDMLYSGVRSADDRDLIRRICEGTDPQRLLSREDYFGYVNYALFVGSKPAA